MPLAEDRRSSSGKRPAGDSAPSTPQKSKSQRSNGADISSPPGQLTLHSFFPITPKKPEHTPALDDHGTILSQCRPEEQVASPKVSFPGGRRTHTLYLVDSKTRLSASLPQHSATLSSRLQLMLYKRLLDALVSSSPPFDFSHLWKHIGLDPLRNFSETFLDEAPLPNAIDSEARCLKDLETKWWDAVRRMRVNGCEGQEGVVINPPVNDQLTLVYRLRMAGPSQRKKGKNRSQLILSFEDQELQAALKESLRHTSGSEDKSFINLETQTFEYDQGSFSASADEPSGLEESDPSVILDPQLDWPIRESLREAAHLSAELNADHLSEQGWSQCHLLVGCLSYYQHSGFQTFNPTPIKRYYWPKTVQT